MRAVQIDDYGHRDRLTLRDIPVPEIGPEDVLVRVKATSINPVDWKIREGYLAGMLPHEFPLTLGWDAAGVVEAVGDKVTDVAVGERVFTRPDIVRNGTYADYLAVRASEVAKIPDALSDAEAAALPLAGITAWQVLVDTADIQPGQRVLIHAGAGGVGHLAIQIAKACGAHVIATASASNQELLTVLGADECIDYQAGALTELIGEPVDAVFDTIGGEVQKNSWKLVRPGGILVSVAEPPNEADAKAADARGEFVFIQPSRRILHHLLELIESDQLKVLIEHRFALEQIVQAHELSESNRVRGKIVIEL